ncbi:DUF3000 family protein [Microbacterium sp. C7(2022)]|uniref:DUF3000 family protein n=1 Tax=Microbacterium sp. C7(2022) TaxID=2992759 RepID=UPI00237B4305|nr:DUF3000 family protein [Microbacterium sp. C7(2022)]MDE0545499.1 DUF3000 domain-containing protein [Microbacterium sp. C7(2022)]
MTDHRSPAGPSSFDDSVEQVRALHIRGDITVREIAAPAGLAAHAFAIAGDVRPDQGAIESAYGTGRLVLLHDEDGPAAWNGSWRIVSFAQAPLETDIGIDPMLADVTWSWLVDALDAHGAAFHSESGTATKILSKGFGSLLEEGDGAQIELRASWSPLGDIAPHVEAWAELVCMLAGLPPGSEGITMLGSRRLTGD